MKPSRDRRILIIGSLLLLFVLLAIFSSGCVDPDTCIDDCPRLSVMFEANNRTITVNDTIELTTGDTLELTANAVLWNEVENDRGWVDWYSYHCFEGFIWSCNDTGGPIGFSNTIIDWQRVPGVPSELNATVSFTGITAGCVQIGIKQPDGNWAQIRDTKNLWKDSLCTILIVEPSSQEPTAPANNAPVLIDISDKVVTAGESLTFTISATDANADTLTFSASNLPSGATFTTATRTFFWTPTADQVGAYPNIHFEVSDESLRDSEDITITVNAPAPPTVIPPPDEPTMVVENISIGEQNVAIALSHDGKQAYIVDQGPAGTDDQGKIWIVDTTSKTVESTIPVTGIGYLTQLALTPDGNKAYLAITKAGGSTITAGNNRIVVIDTSVNRIVKTIDIPSVNPYGPVTVAMHPNGKYLYTANRGDSTIMAIDTTTNTIVNTISSVGKSPMDLILSADGSRMMVVNRDDSSLVIFDIAGSSMTFNKLIPLGFDVSRGGYVFVAITPDDSRVYATAAFDPRIAVIDVNPNSETYQTVKYIENNLSDSRDIAISPDGSRALVAGSNVLIIDIDPGSSNYNTQIDTIKTYGVYGIFVNHPEEKAYLIDRKNIYIITNIP